MGELEQSIAADGWIGAITVAADGETFDGSARLETLATAGLDDPIVVDVDGRRPVIVRRTDIATAEDERAKRLAIAANKIASDNLSWDAGVLAGLANEIDLSGLFREDELAAILAEIESEAQPADDAAPDIDETKPTRCQPGDVWRVGVHLVACLDSTEPGNLDRLVRGRKVGMVVADPPYGIRLDTSYKNSVDNTVRNLKKSRGYAPVAGDDEAFDPSLFLELFRDVNEQFWWGADYYRRCLPDSGSWLVWDKRAGLPEFDYSSSEFELCWSKTAHLREILRVRWFGAFGMEQEGGKRVHPTQKPVAIYTELYKHGGASGDLILDPFLGSGPSLKAAHRLGDRTVVGFELSPAYIDHILEWAESNGLTVARMEG